MNAKIFALLVSLALVATSCQSPTGSNSNGTLVLNLPSPKSAVGTSATYGSLIRLQLVRNNRIVPISGQSYYQQGLAGQTVTLNGLPTGSGFVLYLSTGTMNGQYFQVAYSQISSPFEISAGNTTLVGVTLNPTPLSLVEAGTGTHSATVDTSGNLYFLNGTALDEVQAGAVPSSNPTTLSTNYLGTTGVSTVNNLGFDPTLTYHTLVLDTNLGIAQWNSPSGSFSIPKMIAVSGGQINPVNIHNSGSAYLTYLGTDYPFAAYWGSGIVSGIMFNTANHWSTLSDVLNLSSSIVNMLAKNPQIISWFAPTPQFLYLSTSVGVYRISAKRLAALTGTPSDQTTALGKIMENGTDTDGSTLLNFSDSTVVGGPVSAFSDKTAKALVFVGTGNGVFAGSVDPALGTPNGGSSVPAALDPIAGTTGLNVTSLATASVAPVVGGKTGTVFTAAYSDSTNEVIVFHDQTIATRIPAFAGLPSGTPKFTWYNTGSSAAGTLYLIISGTDSTVSYQAATW